MPIRIEMPRLSDTMEEGTLVKWNVSVGDAVSAGDELADIETDKATMPLQSFEDGTVAKIVVEAGSTVAVGDLIVVLAEAGESVEDAGKGADSAGAAGGGGASAAVSGEQNESNEEKPKPTKTDDAGTGGTGGTGGQGKAPAAEATSAGGGGGGGGEQEGRVRISPLARKLAEEHDVDPSAITGSGPGGRIIKRDVLEAAQGGGAKAADVDVKPQAAPAGGGGASVKVQGAADSTAHAQITKTPEPFEQRTITLSNMRKTIARRLVESKTQIPHFQVTMPIDMDPLMDLRATLNRQLQGQGIKLSVNDFIVRAAALACVQNPIVNSSWAGDKIEQHGTVNIGIAVALPPDKGGGLVVPTLRHAHTLGLRAISEQTRRLAKKAREAGLTPEEMSDGTFTLSNLGMFGVEQFNAIINPPQAAILAVGGAIQQPVVRDGQIVVGHVMRATLSADHRVIDGAIAAEYLQSFKELIEGPAGLLV